MILPEQKAQEMLYQARDFAEKAGVTVRALHHYDHLGLLKPSRRTDAGYRLYAEQDFARLQQIVTLKFLGMSLKQIKHLLQQEHFDVLIQLQIQRQVMEEKRRHLDRAIQAIQGAERVLASGEKPNSAIFKTIIEVIEMQTNTEWLKKYYTEEQLAELAKRGTPEIIAQAQNDWTQLIAEVEANLQEDPGSPKAQSLATRWAKLVEGFTMGNPELAASLCNLYQDEANWPTTFQKLYSDEVDAFIKKAMAIRKQAG
jgi:MerR family transcriptional regulator, thiopeptide resistance regulator